MTNLELIRTRKSVRTFDGEWIDDADLQKLTAYCNTIRNPYDIPTEFILLEAETYGLSSPVIAGEHFYITAKVPRCLHCEEAFGYAFEQMVLYAWSLGIGTTWIGGTIKRDVFEKAAQCRDGELMLCVSPLGYPAKNRSLREIAMRTAVRADKRLTEQELFWENGFTEPLQANNLTIRDALEAVRLAPSAVNKQPWRIVRMGNTYHFYEHHSLPGGPWDVQRVDMGIALCHFMMLTGGELRLTEPQIEAPKDLEYVASVAV